MKDFTLYNVHVRVEKSNGYPATNSFVMAAPSESAAHEIANIQAQKFVDFINEEVDPQEEAILELCWFEEITEVITAGGASAYTINIHKEEK